jgi:hypothetical protein
VTYRYRSCGNFTRNPIVDPSGSKGKSTSSLSHSASFEKQSKGRVSHDPALTLRSHLLFPFPNGQAFIFIQDPRRPAPSLSPAPWCWVFFFDSMSFLSRLIFSYYVSSFLCSTLNKWIGKFQRVLWCELCCDGDIRGYCECSMTAISNDVARNE